MYLLIDNYDSFTWNVYHSLSSLNVKVKVFRNDKISISDIYKSSYKGIIISPGPGVPNNSGISLKVIKEFAKTIPILGICLGHQAIGFSYGAEIVKAKNLMHGQTDLIFHNSNSNIFKKIPSSFLATRYHSLIIKDITLPNSLRAIATNKNKIIMAIEHKKYPLFGLQFHPESIASEYGDNIFKNFINICNES